MVKSTIRRKKSGSKSQARKIKILTLLVVGVLLVAGLVIGGRFAWRYYHQKQPKVHGNSYEERFNDVNAVQLEAAKELGIEPIADREAAESVKGQLVKIEDNEYYKIDNLDYSIPYLTKGGKALLDSIGVNFRDSLVSKGLSAYKFVVSSVLRTEDDVKRLRESGNKNAAKNSAHCFGTTFDINYKRFSKNYAESILKADLGVDKETLKAVLAQVLEDLRDNDMCYVKYEVNQPCFHITSRMK